MKNSREEMYRDEPGRQFDYMVSVIKDRFRSEHGREMKDHELAAACLVSPQMMSMYLSGTRKPSKRTLQILSERMQPPKEEGQAAPVGSAVDPLHEKLSEIKKRDPEGYEVVSGMIQTLYKRVSKPASSAKPSKRDLATKAHPLRAEERERKPTVDEPNASKSSQHTPESPHPKDPLAAPAPVPTER